jgi:hypothetical protein
MKIGEFSVVIHFKWHALADPRSGMLHCATRSAGGDVWGGGALA